MNWLSLRRAVVVGAVVLAIAGAAATVALADGYVVYADNYYFYGGASKETGYDSCPAPWIYNSFLKGSGDWGEATFIDNNGGGWHGTVEGYGNITASSSPYTSYLKKAYVKNNNSSGLAYTGSAQAGWESVTCA